MTDHDLKIKELELKILRYSFKLRDLDLIFKTISKRRSNLKHRLSKLESRLYSLQQGQLELDNLGGYSEKNGAQQDSIDCSADTL